MLISSSAVSIITLPTTHSHGILTRDGLRTEGGNSTGEKSPKTALLSVPIDNTYLLVSTGAYLQMISLQIAGLGQWHSSFVTHRYSRRSLLNENLTIEVTA